MGNIMIRRGNNMSRSRRHISMERERGVGGYRETERAAERKRDREMTMMTMKERRKEKSNEA